MTEGRLHSHEAALYDQAKNVVEFFLIAAEGYAQDKVAQTLSAIDAALASSASSPSPPTSVASPLEEDEGEDTQTKGSAAAGGAGKRPRMDAEDTDLEG